VSRRGASVVFPALNSLKSKVGIGLVAAQSSDDFLGQAR
jgi:hypothetical protein